MKTSELAKEICKEIDQTLSQIESDQIDKLVASLLTSKNIFLLSLG